MTEIGHCKHGEFILTEGCPRCIAERREQGIMPENDEMQDGLEAEGLTLLMKHLVKVQYYSDDGRLSDRPYTYYSEEPIQVGDIVTVPVRDTTGKAQVSAVDVPEAEIQAFKDKVKTIPAGSVVKPTVPEAKPGDDWQTLKPLAPLTDGTAERDLEAVTSVLIRVGPEHDPAVLTLAEEARKLRSYAVARVITADIDLRPATEDLSIIAKVKKALVEKRADYLKPIKAHIDAVNAAFLSIMSPLEEADLITRNKVKEYRAAAEKHRQEAEEINRQKQELAMREAAFNGGEITIDTTPVEAPAPVRRVVTDLGSASTMKVTKWELVDFAVVPDGFKLLDSGKITKLVKAGGTIPGIRVYKEESIRVNAW